MIVHRNVVVTGMTEMMHSRQYEVHTLVFFHQAAFHAGSSFLAVLSQLVPGRGYNPETCERFRIRLMDALKSREPLMITLREGEESVFPFIVDIPA